MERLHLPSSSPPPSFRSSAYIWHLHFSFFAWGLLFGTNFVKKEVSFCKIGSQKNCCSQIMDKVLQEEAEKNLFTKTSTALKEISFSSRKIDSKVRILWSQTFFPKNFACHIVNWRFHEKKSFHFLLTHPSSNSALLHCASSSCRISKIQSAFLSKRIKVVFDNSCLKGTNKVANDNSDKVLVVHYLINTR